MQKVYGINSIMKNMIKSSLDGELNRSENNA